MKENKVNDISSLFFYKICDMKIGKRLLGINSVKKNMRYVMY